MARSLSVLAMFLLASGGALAHPGHEVGGFVAGFSHPVLGADHLLAMVAIGLWAAGFRGTGRWVLPAVFVGFMLLGALLGFAGLPLPGVEPMIAASVLALGLIVGTAARLSPMLGAAIVAGFALFHGHAHFTELRDGASLAAFAAGMLIATALLHLCGIVAALSLGRVSLWLPRALGGAVALAGTWLLVA